MWTEWVSTFSPEVARLTERLLETGELPANLMYSVPREYADAHPDHDRTIWVYRQGSMESGEPFDLRYAPSATDL